MISRLSTHSAYPTYTQRAEIIVGHFLNRGEVLSPKAVAGRETVLLWPGTVFSHCGSFAYGPSSPLLLLSSTAGDRHVDIHLGVPLHQLVASGYVCYFCSLVGRETVANVMLPSEQVTSWRVRFGTAAITSTI